MNKKNKICIYCKKYPVYMHNLCTKCYQITRYNNGSPERVRGEYNKNATKKICSHCGKNNVYAKTLCISCYKYKKRHGSLEGKDY